VQKLSFTVNNVTLVSTGCIYELPKQLTYVSELIPRALERGKDTLSSSYVHLKRNEEDATTKAQ
jgi:hypothetical protein